MRPKNLKFRDKMGIISPSAPVTEEFKEQFDQGIHFLKEQGFEPYLAPNALSNSLGYSASPQEKAEDINRMFADPSIQGIICSQGGMNANACLPYLDWAVIRANPKVFLGMSDITVLLNLIYERTGLITFHGNDLMWGFGRNPTLYDLQEFIRIILNGQSGEIPANGERKIIRGGLAEGTLLGGNIDCLLKLAGTPYFPDLTDAILFVEALDITPARCDAVFHQMKHIGVFEKVRGVIVGYIHGLDNNKDEPIKMEDVLLNVSSEYTFPILKVHDFGHNCPNTVLPVGAKAILDADAQEIEILGGIERNQFHAAKDYPLYEPSLAV